jgi:HK97 family phage major capsid protein
VAFNDVDAWIPEEWGGAVIMRVNRTSAVEAIARREPMGTDTKNVPRSAGVGMDILARGDSYTEDSSANDTVVLNARKFGRALSFTEEDLADTSRVADVIEVKQLDWATTYAKTLDNATLGTSGAENVASDIPFTSVYRAVTNTDSGAGYTASANFTSTASTTYANLSDTLAKIEDSDYFDEADMFVIASPKYRKVLRGLVDSQNRPIFVQGQGGDRGTPDTLFGYPIRWSLGARVSTAATPTPSGPALLIFGNSRYLILGVRSGPETLSSGRDAGWSTDELKVKMRARRGFKVGTPKAFAVLADTSL